MKYESFTKEELISEVQNLKHEINSLKFNYKKEIAEINELDKELKESRERLKEVLENSLDAAYKRNLKTNRYDYFSPAFVNISGFTTDEFLNLPIETVLELIHPDDVSTINQVLTLTLSSGFGSNQFEYRFKHKDGQYRWFVDKFKVVYDRNNQAIALLGSVSDITEQKLAEEKVREKDIQFRKLSATVPDLIYQFTRKPDGSYCVPPGNRRNQKYVRMFPRRGCV